MNQHVVSRTERMTKDTRLSQVVGEPAGTGHAYFVDAGWS